MFYIIGVIGRQFFNMMIFMDSENKISETEYLSSDKRVKDEIIAGKNTPLSECIPESEIEL